MMFYFNYPNFFKAAILFSLLFCFENCTHKENKISNDSYQAKNLISCQQNLTETIIPDILNPPFASRVYVYPCIAAYEALCPAFPQYKSLVHQLTDLDSLPSIDTTKVYHFELAAITAFNHVAQKLVWTEKSIADFQSAYQDSIKSKLEPEVFKRSIDFGNKTGDAILAWASKDHFKQTRSMTRYALSDTIGAWKTTPPDYISAVEPFWGQIRPFVIDTVADFMPEAPPKFDMSKNSDYYRAVMETYDVSKNLDQEKRDIAAFWDCNPTVSKHEGHLTIFNQKMTPGGHWLAITAHICQVKNLDIMQTAEAYVICALALADGFICCWNAKYKFNTIRPVSVINEYLDNDWTPLLQTPPFPEYPSGHSVISGSASTALTAVLGDNIAFTDSSEVAFNLPVRSFHSLNEAADEVSISRVYGGIHYPFACINGLAMGRRIGHFISENVKTRK